MYTLIAVPLATARAGSWASRGLLPVRGKRNLGGGECS